ncbi:MAG TPA: hypothetical protein PLW81_09635 [Thiobacillaceae bacterium]|nr:hypothetical protein [Thiobacillaceae bacterium]
MRVRAAAGLAGLLLGLAAPAAQAQWQFGPAVDVAVGGVFHHLDASGRRALAVSGRRLGLVWEDNRSGAPRCYLALGRTDGPAFREYPFGRGECFEPAVAGLGDGRFALIWEDETGVNAAVAGISGIGQALRLAPAGGHGSLAWHPRLGLAAAWSATEGPWRRVWRQALTVEEGRPVASGPARPADPWPAADHQAWPVLDASGAGLTLAWEDRRPGHTVIFYSHSGDGRVWTLPARLSRNPTGRVNDQLGRGTGAMRPALAGFGEGRLAAVWLDKRDFLSGYDVYAALSDTGGLTYGPDGKAQDSFGDAIAQWHAAVAGNARGDLAIAWDDDRDGTADIWVTRLKADGRYADNVTPEPASGAGAQTDPVIALDEQGRLHLAWIERDGEGQSRLRYATGQP